MFILTRLGFLVFICGDFNVRTGHLDDFILDIDSIPTRNMIDFSTNAYGLGYATDCPDAWTAFKGSCYLFGTGLPVNFVDAENYCLQHDAHLVHVNDKTENAFLRDFLHRLKPEIFWIGLTDEVVEGVWEWYDTKTPLSFSDWYPGEPNDNVGMEDCAGFYTARDFRWNDFPCNQTYEPLCELRINDVAVVG